MRSASKLAAALTKSQISKLILRREIYKKQKQPAVGEDISLSGNITSFGKLVIAGTVETNLRRERQMEGINRAKEKGVYKGRKPSVDVQKVTELRDIRLCSDSLTTRHLPTCHP